MPWELVRRLGRGSPRLARGRCYIQSKGRARFHPDDLDQAKMGDYARVYIDSTQSMLCLRSADKSDEGAYRFRKSGKSERKDSLSFRAALKRLGISPETAQYRLSVADGAIVIDFKCQASDASYVFHAPGFNEASTDLPPDAEHAVSLPTVPASRAQQ